MSVAEFWQLTPRAFDRLIERFKEQERTQDFRAAVVALPLLNWGKKDTDKRTLMEDIFPSLKQKPKQHTPQDQFAAMKAWQMAGFGKMG